MSMAGIADITGCYRGQFVALEVKTPENKKGATKTQELFLASVRKGGGHAKVIRDIEGAVEVIKCIDEFVDELGGIL